MTDLIDTTEMYLKTVYELEEDGIPPLRARIVDRLEHKGPTVSQTVSRMERDGLLEVGPDRSLRLTPQGRRRATDVIRKHRLAERLLLDVVGLDRHLVHDEACRWEHVMSEQVESRLVEMLDGPSTDPFGNAIPEHDAGRPSVSTDEAPAADLVGRDPLSVTVVRIGERIQADSEMLGWLVDAGVLPGARISLRRSGSGVLVDGESGDLVTVPDELARHLFVRA